MRARIKDDPPNVLLQMQGHDGGPVGDEYPWASIEFSSNEALALYVEQMLPASLAWVFAAGKALADADNDPTKLARDVSYEATLGRGKGDFGLEVVKS